MTVSYLPRTKRKCCCEDPLACDCLGDCNDHGVDEGTLQATGCIECCWSVGDAIRFKHVWATTQEMRRETQYASLPTHGGRPQCADVTYEGGSIEVQYIAVGCSTVCPEINTDRVKIIFALDEKFGGVYFDNAEQSWTVAGPGWKYNLQQYLAVTCQSVNADGSGAGDYEWHWYSACDLPLMIPVCVAPCRTGCQDVPYEPCNGTTPRPYCDGSSGLPVHGPDWSNCEHCIDAVADCGGLRAYCGYRWVASECAFSGNAYGQLDQNPIVCGNGCETDMVAGAYHPVETCELAFFQTLEILPPAGATRQCRWHDTTVDAVVYKCCRSAANRGGTEISQPDPMSAVSIPDQSWPGTGWTQVGPDACDCFQNPTTPASCAEWECPATTSLVATGVKVVCNP